MDRLAGSRAARGGAGVLHAGGRPRRPSAAAVHHDRTAAGGCRRHGRRSIRGSSTMLFAYEDRRFTSTAASMRWRSAARVSQLMRQRPHRFGRLDADHAGGAAARAAQRAQLRRQASPDGARGALERTLSKDEILALYLTLAPYGGNLEGIRAASLAYFGKEPRRLTLGRSGAAGRAAAIARGAAAGSHPPCRAAARDRVLDRLAAARVVPADEIERAKQEAVAGGPASDADALAPHLADAAMAAAPARASSPPDHRGAAADAASKISRASARARSSDRSRSPSSWSTTRRARSCARWRRPISSTMRRDGQVDMTQALRSPGSTLKPFIYGLGFELGLIHPETLIDDRPIRFGGYAPENFDLSFQGTVTVRRALQLSLNVPAVAVLDGVGASRFTARLAQAGGALVLPRRRSARPRDRPRRRRRDAHRSRHALCRRRAARQHHRR